MADNQVDDQANENKSYNIILIILAVIFAVVLAFFAWFVFKSFFGSGPGTPGGSGDAIWDRIQKNGKMVVGTSADYPPFEYYDNSYQLDGFDIALIKDVGQQLGVEIEIRDMVFDDLGNALQLDQTDVAIAALTVTDERGAVVDFSDVYFVTQDSILAQQNSAITVINSVPEIAPYRVGVQRSSVFETQLRRDLVNTGLMAAGNLLVYERASDAVRDLTQNRLDLVMLDEPVAKTAVTQNPTLKIVGAGLYQQRMAIAMSNGAVTLQTKINDALRQLSNSGRIHQLAQEYMGLNPDEIIPLPTPPPVTATPHPTATAQPCINGMQFVQDINLDDDNMKDPPLMPPGVPFTKVWRIRNSGTCTWDSSYYLGFVSGIQMGGQSTFINGSVSPGGLYDIAVNFVSPIVPDVYQSFWAMHNGANQAFGDRIWAGIEVAGAPTATPAPTQTPSPSIDFTVDRTHITAGECVTFSWNVQNATAVFFAARGTPWQQVAPQGSRVECPPVTTVYQLKVDKTDGSSEIREITVYVEPNVGAPVITQFSADPTQINAGQCVNVRWQVEGSVSNVNILRDNVTLWGGAPTSGTYQDCPPGTGTISYRVEASGAGGSNQRQQYVTVIAPTAPATAVPPTPTIPGPTPVPTEVPPVINSFTASPSEITAGNSVRISWSIGGGAQSALIKRNGVVVADNIGFNGTVTDNLNDPGLVTYRLEVLGAGSQSTFQEVMVNVLPVPEAGLPLQGPNWVLQSYFDGTGAMLSVLPGSQVTAVFGTDNKLNGSAGCNTYNADYATSGETLTIGAITSGRISCSDPPGIMEQEQAYLNLLPSAAAYSTTPLALEIRDAQGRLIIIFEELKIEPRN